MKFISLANHNRIIKMSFKKNINIHYININKENIVTPQSFMFWRFNPISFLFGRIDQKAFPSA